jgi:hypothetical protein
LKELTMLNRLLPVFLMVVAVAIFAALPALAIADENGTTHEGKIVKITKDELVMTDKDNKEHTHKLNATVKLKLDNKDVQLADIADFKAGMKVRVTTKKGDPKTVVEIEALSKGDFKN